MINVSQIIESYYLIRSAYDRDDYVEVINLFKRNLDEEPLDTSMQITYGLICQIVGSSLKKMNEGNKKDDWMPILEKSLTIFDNFLNSNLISPAQKTDLQLNYANTLCIIDKPLDAFQYYDTIEKNSKDLEVIAKMHVGRSYVHYCLKQFDLGLKEAETAIKFYMGRESNNNRDKQLAYAYNNRGLNHFELGKIYEAKEDFSNAYKFFQKAEFKQNLSNIEAREIQSLIDNNDIKQAIQLVDKINNSEQQKKLYYNIGVKLLDNQDIVSAEKIFIKSLELDPNFEPAKIGLAEYYRRIEHYDEAKKITKQIDLNSKYNASAQNLMGTIYFDQGIYEDALDYFTNAIASLEKSEFLNEGIFVPTLFRNCAMCLYELNRNDEGREYLIKADEFAENFQKQMLNDFI